MFLDLLFVEVHVREPEALPNGKSRLGHGDLGGIHGVGVEPENQDASRNSRQRFGSDGNPKLKKNEQRKASR